MDNISVNATIQIVTSVSTAAGIMATMIASFKNMNARIDRLEVKQDKHNNAIERLVAVEQSNKSAHHRIDDANFRITENTHKIDSLTEVVHESHSTKRINYKART